ncbi:MAG: sulfatase [Atribacterota bacterium]|nr:sulfatase [Atribacterota bacterium]
MKEQNIIIISLDEVRPDHLSCYGYQKIVTPAIDQMAREGVRFNQCFSSADFTPIAMGSVITGKYPNKHGVRDAYSHLSDPTIATILKEDGYQTAGLVGNGLLSRQHGFAQGFDFFNETSKETSWLEIIYPNSGVDEIFYEGNYWVEEFFKWLKKNFQKKFFMWGHLYETHEGSGVSLVKRGLISQEESSEFDYYDAKIKMADEKLIRRLISTLKELNIYDETTIVVMSDHGTNLGEHPVKDIPWRKKGTRYPQHTTMYDHDLHVAMIIKGPGFPAGKVINGMVRSIDLVPTLLEHIGISSQTYDFDGQSWLPLLQNDQNRDEVYSEDLFESRGLCSIHSLRTPKYKFMRNLTLGEEAYFDLKNDPGELKNIKEEIDQEKLIKIRKRLNSFLFTKVVSQKGFSQEEKEAINQRLRGLGYIE